MWVHKLSKQSTGCIVKDGFDFKKKKKPNVNVNFKLKLKVKTINILALLVFVKVLKQNYPFTIQQTEPSMKN